MRQRSDLHIGVLALQGAFAEHIRMLRACGAEIEEVRKPLSSGNHAGLDAFDGMVLPGGESTVMAKFLQEEGLLDALRTRIEEGMPVYGSCAGLILLCRDIEGPDGSRLDQPRLGVLDATARRNAFGRQVDSFELELRVKEVEHAEKPLPALFIRAPLISRVGTGVHVLARVPDAAGLSVSGPVAVRQGNILATSFHPELTSDMRIHRMFLEMVDREKNARAVRQGKVAGRF